MPRVAVNGVELFYEVTGEGFPVIFSHEYGGDYRSWNPQVRYFDRMYQCVTYNHRGFPPSDVPETQDAYTQDHLIADLYGLVQHLGFKQAHFVGFSMGGNIVLNFGMRYPELCRSLVVVGTGTGTVNREVFEQNVKDIVGLQLNQGIEAFAEAYGNSPTRQALRRKDPAGWQEFKENLKDHSAVGSAFTMQGVQRDRPIIFALEKELEQIRVPTLIITGDEDEPCVDPSVFMRRHIPTSGLMVFPQSGHPVNLEEPALFNQSVSDFFKMVEAGRWGTRAKVTTSMLP
jgi:pimeloyl-ACP methyl ester carboxylesterase